MTTNNLKKSWDPTGQRMFTLNHICQLPGPSLMAGQKLLSRLLQCLWTMLEGLNHTLSDFSKGSCSSVLPRLFVTVQIFGRMRSILFCVCLPPCWLYISKLVLRACMFICAGQHKQRLFSTHRRRYSKPSLHLPISYIGITSLSNTKHEDGLHTKVLL